VFSKQIKALYDKAHQLKADAGDDITAEQLDQIEAYLGEASELEAKAQRMADLNAKMGEAPVAKSTVKTGAVITSQKEGFESDPKAGFKTPNEFFKAIAQNKGQAGSDHRLKFLAAAGSDEHNTVDGQYGGFAVPEGFYSETLKTAPEMDPTAGRTRNLPMDAPVVNINARVDKDHSTSVVGGLTVGRRAEMNAASSSRQSMEQITLKVNALNGLSYATDELVNDSPSTIAALLADFPAAFADKEFQEKLDGSGNGEFEGINNSPAMLTIAKESGQGAGTIVEKNLTKMMSRVYGMNSAVWLMNHDALPELTELGGSDKNIWQANAVDGFAGTVYGLPVFFTEYAKSLGSAGDVMLVNWNEYLVGEYQGMQSESSIHVRFVEHEQAFRFGKRNDGRGWWRSVLTPKNGSTKSPFIKLGARA
jgi:HK97 family phage major capsid protein